MQRIKNVVEWLENAVKKEPDKLAFSDGNISLTFAELHNLSKKIGSELCRRGLFKQPVLVQMDKIPTVIPVFLGCAYSGNFYIPIDVEIPEERKKNILLNLNPSLEIKNDNYDEFINSTIDENLIYESLSKQIDSDLLYVVYTSGSTGIPKGAAVTHRAVIDYITNIVQTFNFSEETVHAQAVPFSYSGAVLPVYSTIYCCCQNFIIPKSKLVFAKSTISFLNEYKCNTIYWTPTRYSIIAKSGILKKNKPMYLEKCIFVGEIMSNAILNIWRNEIPEAMYINVLGPTEMAGTCVYYIVDRNFDDEDVLPVGKAYNNIDVFLLNENLQKCENGEEGEIYIRSSTVGCGYYNDIERTKEAFIQNPLNTKYHETVYKTGDIGYYNDHNEIIFLGRKDFQIKLAGNRIELAEIELAASAISGVDLCACIFNRDLQQIYLFYCGNAMQQQIIDNLKKKLPSVMVPKKVIKIESMPYTNSGKIDRTALKNLV